MVLQIGGRLIRSVPSIENGNLDEWFDKYPIICQANVELTQMWHTKMWREKVLFIRQRMQATSDYRENQKVRWIGSHAALTCHIAVMRHVITNVVSVGHFDNFCCWQFGDDSSAHKDGIDIMLEEIAALSRGNADYGRVEVSVFGGYQDARGDAARNSLSLLNALQDDPRRLELKHFCVGRFNTQPVKKQNNILSTETDAILKGIAVDLKVPRIFPACFEWGNLDDFKMQIKDKRRMKDGRNPIDPEEANKTADSTFKPKSLRHRVSNENLLDKPKHDSGSDGPSPTADMVSGYNELKPTSFKKGRLPNAVLYNELPFNVKLKPTVINDKTYKKKRKKKINGNNAFISNGT